MIFYQRQQVEKQYYKYIKEHGIKNKSIHLIAFLQQKGWLNENKIIEDISPKIPTMRDYMHYKKLAYIQEPNLDLDAPVSIDGIKIIDNAVILNKELLINEYIKQRDEAINQVNVLLESIRDEWISVDEDLPKESREYWVIFDGTYTICKYTEDGHWTYGYGNCDERVKKWNPMVIPRNFVIKEREEEQGMLTLHERVTNGDSVGGFN